MATAPKIMSANIVSPVNRMAGFGPVVKFDPTPVGEVDEYVPLANYGATLYYENLLGEHGDTGHESENEFQSPHRLINTALIRGTTESFANAFANTLSANNTMGDVAPSRSPRTSVISGIGVYETISKVIHHHVPPRGQSMNFHA